MITELDVSELVPEALLTSLSEGAWQNILSDLADAARHQWVMLAGQSLFTTRRDYINGIQPVVMQPGQALIALVGTLPNLIEQGMPETDLHDTLLGPNVPTVPVGQRGKHERKDGGYYRAIPFRHSIPTAGGAVGQPMGRAYRAHEAVQDAKRLGKRVYGAAKKLKPTPSSAPYSERALPPGLAPKLKPHHKTDIYAGMIRQPRGPERRGSQYVTFRTISTGSEGWIRPQTEGRALSKQVSEYVARLAPQAIEAYLESLG